MTLVRRLFVAPLALAGIAAYGFYPVAPAPSPAKPPVQVLASAGAPADAAGGNHDEAASRYRGNQSRHWRQVMMAR